MKASWIQLSRKCSYTEMRDPEYVVCASLSLWDVRRSLPYYWPVRKNAYVKLTGWEKKEAPNKAYFDSQYAAKLLYASLSIDSRW